jgi:leucine dehydrogenase
MDVISEFCDTVLGRSAGAGGSGSSGRDAAAGVAHGIRTTLALLYGSPRPAGRTIVVQGLGEVGYALAEVLVAEGARVIGTDIDAGRLRLADEQLGIEVVAPDEALTVECDVLAPCARGGVIADDAVAALRCRAIVGAANNQLDGPATATKLRARGIVYAPDFVVNAGGGIHFFGTEVMAWPRREVEARLAGIADTLRDVFALADEAKLNTVEAALRLARSRSASGSTARA